MKLERVTFPTNVSPRMSSHVKIQIFSWILKDLKELGIFSPFTTSAGDNSLSMPNVQDECKMPPRAGRTKVQTTEP